MQDYKALLYWLLAVMLAFTITYFSHYGGWIVLVVAYFAALAIVVFATIALLSWASPFH